MRRSLRIYGRFSNTAEAFSFLAMLHFRYRSGHVTSGYGATGLADPCPKLPSVTSHTHQTLYIISKDLKMKNKLGGE